MLLLDTCALIYDALSPERLGETAAKAIEAESRQGGLACSDISLWEIAMLISKGRVDPGVPAEDFIELLLSSRRLEVLPITPHIATTSTALAGPRDPADCIIAATALSHGAALATCDARLRGVDGLKIVW